MKVQAVVGDEQFGIFFALFNLSIILNIILDLGITNFNNRNISQNQQLLSKHLSSLLVLKFLLGILYAVICIIVALIIGWHGHELYLLTFLIFNQFLASLILYLRSNISGLQLFRTDSFLSVLDRALMIVICSILLYGNITDTPFKIEWFIYSQTVAYLITAIIVFLVVLRKCEFLKLNYDRTFFIAILKQSYPFAILILLMAFYNRVDPIMLERLRPDGKLQAGIYTQGYQILDAANNFAFLFPVLLLPMFSKMLKNKENIQQILKLSFSLLVAPVILLAAICWFYPKEILDLFFNENTEVSSVVFKYIMIGFIFISSTHIISTLLTANGSLLQLNIIAGCGMLINIILNLILIPVYGAKGAAITSVSTQAITAIIQIIIAVRIFNLKFNYSLIFKFLSLIIILAVIGYVLEKYITNWQLSLLILSLIGVIYIFGIKLIGIKNIYLIVRYNED
ncbi:MAG: flippase [Marinilabiliales bacterium]